MKIFYLVFVSMIILIGTASADPLQQPYSDDVLSDMIDLTKGPFIAPDGTVFALADESGRIDPDLSDLSGSVSQGQTNIHTIYRSSGHIVDLNWGNTSNSLSLTLCSPFGQNLGTLYDSSDGRTDGRIRISVSNGTGFWTYYVYGQNVSGSQTYSLS